MVEIDNITLNYKPDEELEIAYGLIDKTIKINFDMDLYFDKETVKYGICAEITIHEINEGIIYKVIQNIGELNASPIIRNLSHNLNAYSLGEYNEYLINWLIYTKSDKLTKINGNNHRETLTKIRKSIRKRNNIEDKSTTLK